MPSGILLLLRLRMPDLGSLDLLWWVINTAVFCLHFLFKMKYSLLLDLQSNNNSVSVDQGANTSLSKRLRMYKCERCKSQYMGLAMLRQHCKDVHGDQKYYKCHVCGKLFSHPSSRNIHLRLHSGEKPYKCSTCGKKFRVSSHLKDHVRVHTGELTTDCCMWYYYYHYYCWYFYHYGD